MKFQIPKYLLNINEVLDKKKCDYLHVLNATTIGKLQ